MDEKKLNDEQLIYDLEEFAKDTEYGAIYKNALDLIHRLQAENEELREKHMDAEYAIDKWMEENAEQKAEIERLTKEKSFATRKMMESKAKTVELQKQVDELKEERENMQAVIFGLEEDKRLLQKQVDELKETLKLRNAQLDDIRQYDKEIVKDTAKEIFETLFDECWAIKDEFGNKMFSESKIKHIAKERYGVEVE